MAEALIPLASPILGKLVPISTLISRIGKVLKKALQFLKDKKATANITGIVITILGYFFLMRFIPESMVSHLIYLISIGIQTGLVVGKLFLSVQTRQVNSKKNRDPAKEIMNIPLLNPEELVDPHILRMKIKNIIQN